MKQREILFLVENDPEGGYTARAANYSIFTEADSLDVLKLNIKEALRCHFDNEEEIPSFIHLHIVQEETYSYA